MSQKDGIEGVITNIEGDKWVTFTLETNEQKEFKVKVSSKNSPAFLGSLRKWCKDKRVIRLNLKPTQKNEYWLNFLNQVEELEIPPEFG